MDRVIAMTAACGKLVGMTGMAERQRPKNLFRLEAVCRVAAAIVSKARYQDAVLEYLLQSARISEIIRGISVRDVSSAPGLGSYSSDIYPLYPACAKSFQTRSRSMGDSSSKRFRMCAFVAYGMQAAICA